MKRLAKARKPGQLRASRSSSRSRSGNNVSVREIFSGERHHSVEFCCDGRMKGHRPDWGWSSCGGENKKIKSAASCELGIGVSGTVRTCHLPRQPSILLASRAHVIYCCMQPARRLRLHGQAWNYSHVGSFGYPQVRNIDGGCSTCHCHASCWKQGLMRVKDIGERGCDNFQQSLNAAAAARSD